MTLKSSSRYGVKARVVTLHTAEGARNKESLYSYFNQAHVNASSHVGIDANGVADWISRDRASWTLRNGNGYSVNAELCAFARWTRAQWLSTSPVDGCANPRQIVRNAAAWARRECLALGIPVRILTVAQMRAGEAGIIDHDTYTDATGDGSHWDVGEGFPWDVFLADIKALGADAGGDDDLKSDERSWLHELWKGYSKEGPMNDFEYSKYIVDILLRVRKMDARQAGLEAAIAKLSDAVAANSGQDPVELKAAVKTGVEEALAEGTVNVDVTVQDRA